MKLPFVTAICPTYGRFPTASHLLNEAVGSFLWQTYEGPKELLILNDNADQTLVSNISNIRIVNISSKIKTLGEKYNLLLELSRGSVIFPWEDDDISLPNRIKQGVEKLTNNLTAFTYDYFNPQYSWFEQSQVLHHEHSQGVNHNASCFIRDKLRYEKVNGSQDQYADIYAKTNLRCAPPLTKDSTDWTYIYRWGVSEWHLSGHSNMDKAYENAPMGQQGTFLLKPLLREDYLTRIDNYSANTFKDI